MAVIDDCFMGNPPQWPDCPRIFIHASEKDKTLATVEKVIGRLLELEADRDTFLVGIGGGITTDITGFVASTFKRGLRFGLVPTTLLAQVDAAIGGKNGVNFSGFKNMMGTFNEADWVYVSSSFLKTLDHRQLMCGAAEMLKTFLIADERAYHEAVELFAAQEIDFEAIQPLVHRAAEIKFSIVEKDPQDRGIRHLLNFGHTYAHAIEKNDTGMLHGEAVAVGMVMESRIAVKNGILGEDVLFEIESDFKRIGLPTDTSLKEEELEAALLQDKKRSGNVIRMALPAKIGEAVIWEKSVTV